MFEYLEYFGLACIPAFLLLDLVYRRRQYEAPRFWRLYGTLVTVAMVSVSLGVGMLWATALDGLHDNDPRDVK